MESSSWEEASILKKGKYATVVSDGKILEINSLYFTISGVWTLHDPIYINNQITIII